MKKIIFTFLLLTTVFSLRAQEERNIADLDFLYQAIQKTPSYKDQMKNNKSYRELYESLRKDLKTTDDFDAYQKLMKLIFPIRDNHLGFYRKSDSTLNFVPNKPVVDVAELEKKYTNYPIDSIEGIYHKGNSKYLIYQAEPKKYELINLADGQLKNILFRNEYGSYDVIQFLKSPYSYVLERSVKLQNGLLVGLNYQKGDAEHFYNVLERKKNYEYKMLNDQVGYLSLGTFSAYDKTVKEATEFFNEAKPKIIVKTLIVDIRNNGGGAYKNSRQFINFLNSFKGKIYILQNGFTVSNAEQFILKLKGKDNVVTLGETTKGKITYGSNYSTKITLPSNRFIFYPTDMPGASKELLFESIGIKPDVTLTFTEDWITQTLNYIKAN